MHTANSGHFVAAFKRGIVMLWMTQDVLQIRVVLMKKGCDDESGK